MSALLRSMLACSDADTRLEAHNRLVSEARVTVHVLDDAARMLEESRSLLAERLRTRAKHLRAAIEANEV